MRSDTGAVRDRILAVLREAERPLTTAEVADRAGRWLESRTCGLLNGHPWWHSLDWQLGTQFVSCDGQTDTFSNHLSLGQRAWRELARLEKQGTITGHRERGRKSVLWLLVDAPVSDEITALEKLFALPAAERAS